MGRQKAADEVFCTSLGAAIKQAAEICPECGVRNDAAGQSGGWTAVTAGGRPTTGGTGQASTEPTVSANWWYGVALCLGLWVFVFALLSVAVPNSLDAFLGFLVLLAWIGPTVTAYYDLRYVRGHSDWQPQVGLWVIGFSRLGGQPRPRGGLPLPPPRDDRDPVTPSRLNSTPP